MTIFIHYWVLVSQVDIFYRAAQKVEEGVTQEIMKKFADDKKVSKKEKDER